jgi:hypothetical protein
VFVSTPPCQVGTLNYMSPEAIQVRGTTSTQPAGPPNSLAEAAAFTSGPLLGGIQGR